VTDPAARVAGTWVYPLPAQPDQDSTAAASPMKGFSSQAGAAFSSADPSDASAGTDTSEARQHNSSISAGAGQPDGPSQPAEGSQPSAQPHSGSSTEQAERVAEVSSSATAAGSDGASEASAAHADGAPASGNGSAGSAHAEAFASPFMRHVQELVAVREEPGVPNAQATASGSADDDTQSLAAEVLHETADNSADKPTETSAARPCSAATCSCGTPDEAAADSVTSRATADVRSGDAAAAKDTERSPTDTATEASISLQSSPDGQDRPGALSTAWLATCMTQLAAIAMFRVLPIVHPISTYLHQPYTRPTFTAT